MRLRLSILFALLVAGLDAQQVINGGGAGGGGGVNACEIPIAAQTSVTINKGTGCNSSSNHGFDFSTNNPYVLFFDNSSPSIGTIPGSVTVNRSTSAIVVTFGSAATGTISISSGGVGQTGQTGAVGAQGPGGGTITVTNDGSTGTTVNLLAKINSSGNAVKAGTSDTAVPTYLCVSGCGTSGSATLEVGGSGTCQADASGVTAGHFVITSTATAGRCADGGTTAPTTAWVVGIAQSTAAANATFTLLNAPGYNGTAGGSSGGPGITLYHTTSAWSITTGAWTAIPVDTIDFDSSGGTMWTSGTAVKATSAGRYRVTCTMGPFTAANGGTPTYYMAIAKNASGNPDFALTLSMPALGTGTTMINGSRVLNLANNDTATCMYFAIGTGAGTVSAGVGNSAITMEKVGW